MQYMLYMYINHCRYTVNSCCIEATYGHACYAILWPLVHVQVHQELIMNSSARPKHVFSMVTGYFTFQYYMKYAKPIYAPVAC